MLFRWPVGRIKQRVIMYNILQNGRSNTNIVLPANFGALPFPKKWINTTRVIIDARDNDYRWTVMLIIFRNNNNNATLSSVLYFSLSLVKIWNIHFTGKKRVKKYIFVTNATLSGITTNSRGSHLKQNKKTECQSRTKRYHSEHCNPRWSIVTGTTCKRRKTKHHGSRMPKFRLRCVKLRITLARAHTHTHTRARRVNEKYTSQPRRQQLNSASSISSPE